MIGAIAGDIIGSRFEWFNHKDKQFELFSDECSFTDDSVMTIAVFHALMNAGPDFSGLKQQAIRSMQEIGRKYPYCGYGTNFAGWLDTVCPQPYNSYGNGAAMRVSGCGYAGSDLAEVRRLARTVTEVSHNHPEGIKGAEATAVCVYLARCGCSMKEIRETVLRDYYPIDFTLDSIREDYFFDVSCQGSVPQALEAFFESRDYEDAVRGAVSIGGDSDTIAAITGAVAGAYYGVPGIIRRAALSYLDDYLKEIVLAFEKRFPV